MPYPANSFEEFSLPNFFNFTQIRYLREIALFAIIYVVFHKFYVIYSDTCFNLITSPQKVQVKVKRLERSYIKFSPQLLCIRHCCSLDKVEWYLSAPAEVFADQSTKENGNLCGWSIHSELGKVLLLVWSWTILCQGLI